MKKTVYYAHFMGTYDTIQEKKEINTLEKMGFKVINPNDPEVARKFTKARKKHSEYVPAFMEVFGKMVEDCDVFAFSSMKKDRRISSGVYLELKLAFKLNKPVIELTSNDKLLVNRQMSVSETIKALGGQVWQT